jgi:hypothetical protein
MEWLLTAILIVLLCGLIRVYNLETRINQMTNHIADIKHTLTCSDDYSGNTVLKHINKIDCMSENINYHLSEIRKTAKECPHL